MAKRTQKEVDIQIAALKLERAMLPQRSQFGGENWKMIDAKVEILQGKFDFDLTTDEAEDEFGEEGIMDLELVESWLDGAECDPPCGDEELVEKASQSLSGT